MMKIDGVDDVVKTLQALDEKIKKKYIGRALKKAAVPALRLARLNAPRKTGLLSRSMKSFGRSSKYGKAEIIAPVFPDTNAGINMYYGRFVHEGTKKRTTSGKWKDRKRPGRYIKGGAQANRGTVKANPFLTNALDQTAGRAISIFAEELERQISQ